MGKKTLFTGGGEAAVVSSPKTWMLIKKGPTQQAIHQEGVCQSEGFLTAGVGLQWNKKNPSPVTPGEQQFTAKRPGFPSCFQLGMTSGKLMSLCPGFPIIALFSKNNSIYPVEFLCG